MPSCLPTSTFTDGSARYLRIINSAACSSSDTLSSSEKDAALFQPPSQANDLPVSLHEGGALRDGYLVRLEMRSTRFQPVSLPSFLNFSSGKYMSKIKRFRAMHPPMINQDGASVGVGPNIRKSGGVAQALCFCLRLRLVVLL